jgi:hypothetical protein
MRLARLGTGSCFAFPGGLGLILTLLLLIPWAALLSPPASAKTVVEAWRSGGFYNPGFVSVNPTDGSCWVADEENWAAASPGASQ